MYYPSFAKIKELSNISIIKLNACIKQIHSGNSSDKK